MLSRLSFKNWRSLTNVVIDDLPPGQEGAEGASCYSYLQLADRSQGKSVILKSVEVIDTDFDVRWNQTSTAFTLSQDTPYGGQIYTVYVSNPAQDVFQGLSVNPEFQLGQTLYYDETLSLLTPIFDISVDGDAVLLRTTEDPLPDGQRPTELMVWVPASSL